MTNLENIFSRFVMVQNIISIIFKLSYLLRRIERILLMKKFKKSLLTLLLLICVCCHSSASAFVPVLLQLEDTTITSTDTRP